MALPSGSVHAGSYTVTAPGGKDVGPLTSSVILPPPMHITPQFAPGAVIPCDWSNRENFKVTWTGGDDGSVVKATLRTFGNGGLQNTAFGVALGSAGKIDIPGILFTSIKEPPVTHLDLLCGYPAEIDVTQTPVAITSFSAPGLSLGGRHAWKYEFLFEGLMTQ